MRRRDLIGINPSDRMVLAMRRALAVVFGTRSNSRRAEVLTASFRVQHLPKSFAKGPHYAQLVQLSPVVIVRAKT